jgi:peptidoglycan/LPS O-acetylase OafA/YrhL
MADQPTSQHIHGLDTLRALAIALVLMYHYRVVVSGQSTFGVLTDIGWAGVDLFFVLSGYLIGNQIFASLARGEGFSIKRFLARRLLRTLPNYYVVLAAYLLLPAILGGSSTAPLWRFMSFTQNIGLRYGQTFTHSWSLCIEEQFYLLLPCVVLLLGRLRRPIPAAWATIALCLFGGMAARAWLWAEYDHDPFAAPLYYASVARFDELLPGVAIALLRNFHTPLFAALMRRGNRLLLLGLALAAIALWGFQGSAQQHPAVAILGFPLLAIGFALLTLSALSHTSWLNRVRVPGAGSLALWSYAIYLAHKPIFMVLLGPLKQVQMDPNSPLAVVIIMAAGISAGWLLFKLVETPFMRLRARWYPRSSVEVDADRASWPAAVGEPAATVPATVTQTR